VRKGMLTARPRNENRFVTTVVLAPLSLVKERLHMSRRRDPAVQEAKESRAFIATHRRFCSTHCQWQGGRQACSPGIESMTGHHDIKDLWEVTRLDGGSGGLIIYRRSVFSMLLMLLSYCLSFLLSLTTWNLAIGSPVLYLISFDYMMP